MLFYKKIFFGFFFVSISNVVADLVDPWEKIGKELSNLETNIDYLAFDNDILDSKRFQFDYNYSLPQQLADYEQFWDQLPEKNSTHLKLYNDLQVSANEFNNTDALYQLVQINLYGSYGFPTNKTLAFQYLERFNELVNYSNSTTLFEAAVMYSTGFLGTIPIDIPKSLVYYEKAALLGDIRAKQALAYRYFVGLNVPRDCDRALLIYRDIAQHIKESYTPEEWSIYFPPLESYNLRVTDFEDGLIGTGLNMIASSLSRTPTQKPDLSSIFFSNMNEGRIVLSFKSENIFAGDDDDADTIDELVSIYYNSLDLYRGTYNNRRDAQEARKRLENVFLEYDGTIHLMENIQLYFYCRCLGLLGHLYLTGDGMPNPDVRTAEFYLRRSVEVVDHMKSIVSPASFDLGLINQYGYHNITKAVEYYKAIEPSLYNDGSASFQLAKLAGMYPDLKLGDQLVLMQRAYTKGYTPAIMEFAKMLEDSISNHHSCDDTAYLYKTFIEENDHISAPQLKDAYINLLLGKTEIALWGYLQAAEQGFETALVSVAHILHRPAKLLENKSSILDDRVQIATSYYSRAFKLHNTDAGVVAGNLYYENGDYARALTMYQSASLKYSTQALWNLGYMYEYGLGVERDYNLAKRFYDEALEFNGNILLGIKLSLWKLQWKSWWSKVTGRDFSKDEDTNLESSFSNLPWYKKLAIVFKNVINDNMTHVREESNTSSNSNDSGYLTTITEMFGLTSDDIYAVFIIICIISFYLLARNMARRRGIPVAINGQPAA